MRVYNIMYLSIEDRKLYRSKLIVYYYNKVKQKNINTMDLIRRQVEQMTDKDLKDNYDRLIGNV